MASVAQKFVLVGPHAGKSMTVNGHEFVDGEFTYQGSAEQAATLARVFRRYAALPVEHAELMEFKNKERPPVDRTELDKALSALPGDQTDPDYVVRSMASHFGELFTADDEATVRKLVFTTALKPDSNDPEVGAKVTLAEAIGQLDPAVDSHWTSNNLPALEVLETLVGKKVGRADVEAVADGYTRAKARAAKQ